MRIHWVVQYPTGHTVEEPAEDASIRLVADGAAVLAALRPDGSPITSINLRAGGHVWQPVFYRRRAHTLEGGQRTLVVLGRVRASDQGPQWDILGLGEDGLLAPVPHNAVDPVCILARLS